MGKENWTQRNNRVVRHFDVSYGVDESRLEGWQRLCTDVSIAPGISITQCKKALKAVNVNIVDLVNAKRSGGFPQHFASKGALAAYITRPGKTFPLKRAKENGFLKVLLVEVWGRRG